MSEIRVNRIAVNTDPEITIASPMDITDSGTAGSRMAVGTTAERHSNPPLGMMRWNTTEDALELWNGTEWYFLHRAGVGTQNSPAVSGMEILAAGLPSGNYWIQPAGQTAYEMYVDNDRNGGGWVLCARVTTASCQAHMTTGSVNLSGSTGPRLNNGSTVKMTDSWINSLRTGSTYTGTTPYWMEATDFNKNQFQWSSASVNLEASANTQDARTYCATSYEGSLSNRDPNTGTRGFGDHHTDGTYFAWGRHPEQGTNCGFRSDAAGSSNGFLWVK
jgi:hypothetical protein